MASGNAAITRATLAFLALMGLAHGSVSGSELTLRIFAGTNQLFEDSLTQEQAEDAVRVYSLDPAVGLVFQSGLGGPTGIAVDLADGVYKLDLFVPGFKGYWGLVRVGPGPRTTRIALRVGRIGENPAPLLALGGRVIGASRRSWVRLVPLWRSRVEYPSMVLNAGLTADGSFSLNGVEPGFWVLLVFESNPHNATTSLVHSEMIEMSGDAYIEARVGKAKGAE